MSEKEFKSPAYSVIAVPVEKIEQNTYSNTSEELPEMRLQYGSKK